MSPKPESDPQHLYAGFMELPYEQVSRAENPEYRDRWILEKLYELSSQKTASPRALLDVGAGSGPYRQSIVEMGFKYSAHDFASYEPDECAPGLQNDTWDYTELDFTCDILDIPDSAAADIVISTEVLEHVPDPARAFHKLWTLVRPSGALLITVPFLSLMHQAPHWYSSGLSPFWFAHHASVAGCTNTEIIVHGDYFDLMEQEVGRVLRGSNNAQSILLLPLRVICRGAITFARKKAPVSAKQMGGFGVTFSAMKPSEENSL